MNYRYTQKDIKIIDMSNEADFMYNWIRKHSGRVKLDDVTTDETNDSNAHLDVRGSNDNKNKAVQRLQIFHKKPGHRAVQILQNQTVTVFRKTL